MANILNARDQEILALAWKCFETEPKVDSNKLAELCGFTNPQSATNALNRIKKKLYAHLDGPIPASTPRAQKSTRTPKSATKKRGTMAEDKNDDGSPTKKTKQDKGKTPVKDDPTAEETALENGDHVRIKTENHNEDEGEGEFGVFN